MENIPFFEDIGDANDIFDPTKYALDRTFQITSASAFGKLKNKAQLTSKTLKHKLTFTKKMDKLGKVEVVTKGNDISVEVTNSKLVDKTELSALLSSTGKHEACCKHKSEFSSSMVEAKLELGGDMSATASGVVGYEGVCVGIEAEISPNDEMINDYNAAIDWQVDKSTNYSLVTSKRCDVIAATFLKRFSEEGQIATRLNYDFVLKTRNVDVGAQYKYGGGMLTGMLGSTGVASLLYQRSLSDKVKMSAACGFNALTGGNFNTSWKLEFDA